MHFDFSQIQDIDSYVSIPEGAYVCRIAEVREGLSRDGSPRWSVRLEVSRGEYAGRTAGWDSLTWSDRGIRRVKRVLESLGIDVRGPVEIVSSDLLGREAHLLFQAEEREDPLSGRRVLRLRVPYAGYAPLDGPPPVADRRAGDHRTGEHCPGEHRPGDPRVGDRRADERTNGSLADEHRSLRSMDVDDED